MSRETDSSSSGPQGRGGAAYPSGTPPYGPPGGDRGPGADRAPQGAPWQQGAEPEPEEPAADGPETQTTLTTRIRINIPGSRPIPPVVMRTPVADGGNAEAAGPSSPIGGRKSPGAAPGGAPSGAPSSGSAAAAQGAPRSADAPAAEAQGEKTSDWFAPRKPAQQGGGSGAPAGTPGGAPAPSAPAGGGTRGDLPYFSESGENRGGGPGRDSGAPGGPSGAPGTPGGPSGAPGAGRGPGGGGAPGIGGATGPGAEQGTDNPLARSSLFGPGPGAPTAPGGSGPSGPAGPSGPTGGPAMGDGPGMGDGPMLPAAFQKSAGAGSGISAGPAGPGPGGPAVDETAMLTPQSGDGPPPGGRHVSGDTLTSGIPVVPSGPQADSGFPGPSGPGARHTPPVLPDPPAPRQQQSDSEPDSYAYEDEGSTAPRSTRNAKKGRNKLVLIGAGVVVLVGVAYGAGLLMNHSDVPKGTTALGVDIGGGTRDEAVKKLDAAIAKRASQSVQLSIDGDKATLKPSQAGLSVDTQETVRAAAGSDYNPISVIGSLFGAERVVEPVMPTDKEKLRDALERVAGTSGSAAEATIKFLPGKAVPSYGKSGKQLNPEGSVAAVEAAYRTQIETGSTTPVQLPVSAADPNVPKAEVDRMMKEFATPAMSGLITVRTDAAHTVSFSPEKSIYKFVRVVPSEDRTRLVPYYDREVLKELYGGAFDDVRLTMADGSKKPVTPALVAQAVNRALVGRTPAERIVQIGPEQQN